MTVIGVVNWCSVLTPFLFRKFSDVCGSARQRKGAELGMVGRHEKATCQAPPDQGNRQTESTQAEGPGNQIHQPSLVSVVVVVVVVVVVFSISVPVTLSLRVCLCACVFAADSLHSIVRLLDSPTHPFIYLSTHPSISQSVSQSISPSHHISLLDGMQNSSNNPFICTITS